MLLIFIVNYAQKLYKDTYMYINIYIHTKELGTSESKHQTKSKMYAFFWVIPQRLNLICQRFGTLCLFHLHRRVGMSVLKSWHLKFRCRGITQKKAYNIQNTAKVWNQEKVKCYYTMDHSINNYVLLTCTISFYKTVNCFFIYLGSKVLPCSNTNSIPQQLLLLLLLLPHYRHHHIHSFYYFAFICDLHNKAFSNSKYYVNGRVIWLKMNSKGHGGRWYWLSLRYYPGSCLQRMRKHMENFSENSHL